MMTPTQRSLKKLREDGYLAAIVEKWNPHARVRQDAFELFDLIAAGNGEIVGVQTTSGSNASARVKKITEHANTPLLRKAGFRILVHAWRKLASGRVECRVIDLS